MAQASASERPDPREVSVTGLPSRQGLPALPKRALLPSDEDWDPKSPDGIITDLSAASAIAILDHFTRTMAVGRPVIDGALWVLSQAHPEAPQPQVPFLIDIVERQRGAR